MSSSVRSAGARVLRLVSEFLEKRNVLERGRGKVDVMSNRRYVTLGPYNMVGLVQYIEVNLVRSIGCLLSGLPGTEGWTMRAGSWEREVG